MFKEKMRNIVAKINAEAYGPIIQGAAKSINVLSCGGSANYIVTVVVITSVIK